LTAGSIIDSRKKALTLISLNSWHWICKIVARDFAPGCDDQENNDGDFLLVIKLSWKVHVSETSGIYSQIVKHKVKAKKGEIIMGDYLEEILDNNDLEMDIMAALDEGALLNDYYYTELPTDLDVFNSLDTDYYSGA
jgi:hypothetical protein